MQLRVLSLGLLKDGNVGVAVLLEREEIVVGGLRLDGVAPHGICSTVLEMRERAEELVAHYSTMFEGFLKLSGARVLYRANATDITHVARADCGDALVW